MPPTDNLKPCSLLLRTRQLLRDDPRSLHDVAVQSQTPFYWLRKFHTGEIKDPGVNRVQRLYEFLTASTLTVS